VQSKYELTFETWNKIAEIYEEKFMDLTIYNDSYDYLCSDLIGTDSRILELGCGPGNITKYLLNKRPDFKVYGIDIAPKMIELAQRNNPSALFEVMDVRNIHTLDQSFDAVVCGFCLPYLSHSDVSKLISDSSQLLSDNGFFYASFVEGEPEQSGYITGSTGDQVYFYYHRLVAIEELLVFHCFEILRTDRVVYRRSDGAEEFHCLLTARKMLDSTN
jgi:ubiquinone/menaquinone biosynthesis C-methylase UbiE